MILHVLYSSRKGMQIMQQKNAAQPFGWCKEKTEMEKV
jgi:hypothetical protein